MECQTCNGMRFVSVKRQQMVTKTVYYSKDGYPQWQCDGGTPVRETFPTGRTVTHQELCLTCHGSGLAQDPERNPDCRWCNGTGQTHAYCSSGDWVPEQCQCEAPIPALEAF